MTSHDDVNNIRVLRVTTRGAERGWSLLSQAVSELRPDGFVSLDTEFSGLAETSDIEHSDLRVRYGAIRAMADSRALLSLGVSFFNPVKSPSPASENDTPTYEVLALDFLLKCNSPFSVTANAGQFLVSHGFDFNDMFENGIEYTRASTEKTQHENMQNMPFRWGPPPRGLLWRIGKAAVPIIVHNGFMDLALLYAAFHDRLPDTLDEFVSKLLDSVPAGIFDTKVLATAPGNETASFLSYLFAKAVLRSSFMVRNRKNLPPDCMVNPVQTLQKKDNSMLCPLYAIRGYCPAGTKCTNLHDPFMVVRQIEQGCLPKTKKEALAFHKRQRKAEKALQKATQKVASKKLNKKARRRLIAEEQSRKSGPLSVAAENNTLSNPSTAASSIAPNPANEDGHSDKTEVGRRVNPVSPPFAETKTSEQGASGLANGLLLNRLAEKAHSAGWDAFCTGYCFANYKLSLESSALAKCRNRIHLIRKKHPLLLCKSNFLDLDQVEVDASLKTNELSDTKTKTPDEGVSTHAFSRNINHTMGTRN